MQPRRPNNNRKDNRKQDHLDGDNHLETRVLTVRRISRMYHGGRRLRFSAVAVAGDRQGKVGLGLAKAQDAQAAQKKAAQKAARNLQQVALRGNTLPHDIVFKYKATKVMLRPAAPGTGVVAGNTVKVVAELAGVKDMLSKVIGSTNIINTAQATVAALSELRAGKIKKDE